MDTADLRLAISIGDYNGVGPEILLKAFSNELLVKRFTPVVFASAHLLNFYKDKLQLDVEYHQCSDLTKVKPNTLNVFEIKEEVVEIHPGKASKHSGAYAVASLYAAIESIKNGHCHNIVTLPFDKNTVQDESFSFPGHTEYLAETFDSDEHMMLLVNEGLRVGVVTGHIPLKEISNHLTQERIQKKLDVLLHSLRFDFGIRKPKVAVLGLNPHAGDQGVIGEEEKEIIQPALKKYLDEGQLVYGPYSADGFFGSETWMKFDAVLAMYHDQGLIPFKQLAFHSGVNFTAGLPIIRTSPDHGTAYDIAGKGTADVSSFVQAMYMVNRLYENRMEHNEITSNPLKYKEHRREKFSIGVPKLR